MHCTRIKIIWFSEFVISKWSSFLPWRWRHIYQQLPDWYFCHQQQSSSVWILQVLEPIGQTRDLYRTRVPVNTTQSSHSIYQFCSQQWLNFHNGRRLTTEKISSSQNVSWFSSNWSVWRQLNFGTFTDCRCLMISGWVYLQMGLN